MFNSQINIKFFILILVIISGIHTSVFGFDLLTEISSRFQKDYDGGYSDEYLSDPYKSVYSKDPYGDQLKRTENMSAQKRLAGIQGVERALAGSRCSMSRKKVWGMLYYFVPEFRVEIARSLKMELGDFDRKKYVLTTEEIQKYCEEYYKCGVISSDDADENGDKSLTANTPKNIMTNCKEFFTYYYYEGEDNEERFQNVQTAELAADKYWNASSDDSPYDIMIDFSTLARLLFEDAQPALKPVFYNLPMFKNSIQEAADLKAARENGSYEKSQKGKSGGNGNGSENPGGNGGGQGGIGGESGDGGSEGTATPTPTIIPLPGGNKTLVIEAIDDLIEGLSANRLSNGSSVGGNRVCGGETEEEEVEPVSDTSKNQPVTAKEDGRELPPLEYDDYKRALDIIQEFIDGYGGISDSKQDEIKANGGDNPNYEGAASEDEMDKVAGAIKKCWDTCEGLRLDQKMSCQIMCACGEITSADDKIFGVKNKLKIFDPEEHPGLGPVFWIRFCAIPAVDTKFSVGGRKIVSLEEGVKEILGVVDKLAREGKLGMWTQEYNFLDSSTKKMNISKTFDFSINVEFVDIGERPSKQSNHYKELKAKNNNKINQKYHHISNPLDDPASKNYYSPLNTQGNGTQDYGKSVSTSDVVEDKEDATLASEPLVDKNDDARAGRYATLSLDIDRWIEQQADLWTNTLEYIKSFNEDAEVLYGKRPEKAKSKGK